MDRTLLKLDTIKLSRSNQYIIFGAGQAGKILSEYIHGTVDNILICDNNPDLQDDVLGVISVEKATQIDGSIFLVGFFGNIVTKIESALNSLHSHNIDDERILLIDMSKIREDLFCNEIGKIRSKEVPRKIINKVEAVCFLAQGHTEERAKTFGGGPLGAIIMQRTFLSDLHIIDTYFPYYDYESINYSGGDGGSIYPMICAYNLALSNSNTIYIANDFFSAYGVLMAGGYCCLIHHAQGDIVREFKFWGNNISDSMIKEILNVEDYVMKNAFQIRFPSEGAKKYFKESFDYEITFSEGTALYNTICDFPTPELVENINRDSSYITFFSTGQMTKLKGMDRIPIFLDEFARRTNKRIRWIVVADGVLKDQVHKDMQQIIAKNDNIEFINIDYKLSHAQIYYLMQICDVYLMLHRVSIFDFSTLEAMYMSKAIILSNIQGNTEYNKSDNICLVDDDVDWDKVVNYVNDNKKNGEANRIVYDTHFSSKPFIERYTEFIENYIVGIEGQR